jgi:hypothetical protein
MDVRGELLRIPAASIELRKRGGDGGSKQAQKLIYAEARLPDDRAEGAPIQFVMLGDDNLCERFISTQDDVTSLLTLEVETGLL